jgi:hypothetical protein
MRCQKARSSALPGKGAGLWLGDFDKFLIPQFAVVLILGACSSPKKGQGATIATPSVDALAARVTSLAKERINR